MSIVHEPEPRFLTIGVIAQELGVPVHRVQYVLNSRPSIRPSGRAGNARVFDQESAALIRHELRKMESRRRSRGGE